MTYPLTFETYQQGLREGKLLGLHCRACDQFIFPPQGVCSRCGGHDLNVVEMSRGGEVRTFTVIRVPPEGMEAPYVVAMVYLDNGAWVIGRLANVNPDEADPGLIGRKVKVGSEVVRSHDAPEEGYNVLSFFLL